MGSRIFGGENALSKFLNSFGFIYIIAAVTLLFWTLKLDFQGVAVLCAISGLCFFFCKDATPAMTAVIFMFFVFSDTALKMDGNELYLLLALLPIAGAIYNIVRFKAAGFRLQGFSFSVLVTLIPWFLQGIGIGGRGIGAFFCVGIAVLFALVYFGISVCMRRNGGELINYMAHILLALSLLIVIQIFITNYRIGDYKFENGSVKLGWGTRNPVAAILGLCFPVCFYFATKKHWYSFLFILLGYAEFIVILCLQSRGVSLFATVALPIMAIYSCVAAKHRIPVIIANVAVILALVLTYEFDREVILALYERLLDSGLNPNGRQELYSYGLDEFLNHPIFGTGFDRENAMRDRFFSHSNGPIYYHSTIIQILACFGFVGVFAYMYFYYWRYRVMLTDLDPARFAIFIGMCVFELYCFVDTVYFHPMGYFLMLCITLCAEKGLTYEQTKPNVFILADKISNRKRKVVR